MPGVRKLARLARFRQSGRAGRTAVPYRTGLSKPLVIWALVTRPRGRCGESVELGADEFYGLWRESSEDLGEHVVAVKIQPFSRSAIRRTAATLAIISSSLITACSPWGAISRQQYAGR